ncbi:unnamed protein product [Enterobius vermicularis]|uniref:SSD domain-containing protein n=1 Tax=Enterobius vermicularis TaxID=51028 RepID=A0A0N4VE17_ENTVE|nr:unnamed protein product [Enterobius vermicularis]
MQYKDFFDLTYPLATVGPFKSNIGKFLFDRTVNATGHITSSRTLAVYFTTFVNTSTKARRLQLFEKHVLKQVEKHNAIAKNAIRFVLHGAYPVSQEVKRGVKTAAKYYLTGAVLLISFVIGSFILASLTYRQKISSYIAVIAAAILSPVLASITALGIVLLIGLHINMLVLISPFLTLAMGIGNRHFTTL